MAKLEGRVDLQAMAKEIEQIIERYCGGRPGLVITFTLPQSQYRTVHWVSNIDRMQAIQILKMSAEKMTAHTN